MPPPEPLPADPAPDRVWPPTARPAGTDLSVVALLAILVVAFGAELLVFGATSAPASGRWPHSSAAEAVARYLVLPGALTLGVSTGVVLVLGWQRAAGLSTGVGSRWAVAPALTLGFLSVAIFARTLLPDVDESVTRFLQPAGAVGAQFLALLLVGLGLAAAAEEVMFRGFLLYGLTRRVEAEWAVIASSLLFAIAHVPSLIALRLPSVEIALTLIALAGIAVVLCRIRAETGSLLWPTIVHTLWNFVTFGVAITPWATSELAVSAGLVKLALIVVGLVMAVGLARRHHRRRARQAVPPVPPPMPIASWAPALPPPPPPPGAVTPRPVPGVAAMSG